jgi:carboxypeptidase family protein/TonB-dependent receptor-like protein
MVITKMKTLLRVVCGLVCAWAAFAQTGTITGTVADPAGAVIANAAVEVKNLQTGAAYPAVSTETGNYTVSELPVGTYEVGVMVSGFKKFTRTGITVTAAQVLRIDVAMEVGATSESVTVQADASLLKTETADVSHNVTVQTLNELPMLGVGSAAAGSSGIRNPNGVVNLVPGTYYVPNSQVKVNGAPSNSMAIRVEGMDSTNVGFPYAGAQTQPSVDAIQEASVQTSNYAPEYGSAAGGLFNFTMRSGTNQYHGSAYDYFVNEVLNAGQPLIAGNPRPPARRNDYGFTFGGPVRIPKVYNGHDRTFFFFNFEQYRETIHVNNIPDTVPIDAYRQGNFAQAITSVGSKQLGVDPLGRPIIQNTVYNPASAHLAPNGQLVTDPFANNQVPSTAWDPVALAIQKNFPEPNVPGALINNFLPNFPATRHTTIPAVKADQIIGPKSKISFYWSFTHTDAPYSNIYGQSEGFPDIITATRGTFIHSHVERLNYDLTVSPTLLLHLGAGYQQNNFFDDAPILNFNAAATYGLKGATVNRNTPVFTGFCPTAGIAGVACTAAGGANSIGPVAGQGHSYWEKPSGNASITWVKSNHTYKAGAEAFFQGVPNIPYTNTYGNYTISANETALPYLTTSLGQNLSGGTVGFPYASFLMGLVDSYQIAAPAEWRNGKQQWSLFLQDSWKLTRTITLDYGVRWDYGTAFSEEYGREMNFSPTLANPNAGGLPGGWIFGATCHCSFANNYPYAIGPRVGLAWQITPKTVLRAGWGLLYGQTAVTSLGIANPGTAVTNQVQSVGQGTPAMTLSGGIPQTTIPSWPVFNAGIFPGTSPISTTLPAGVGFYDPNAGRPPRQNQWSVGLQRELTKDLVVEASYVGNRGVWWQAPGLENINAITPAILAAHNINLATTAGQQLLLSPVSSATAVAAGITLPYANFPKTQTVAQAIRPFPQFGTINAIQPPLGKTWYDGLQAKVTKRMSHGLQIASTFAWQKSMQEGVDTVLALPAGGQNYSENIVTNKANAKSISGFDQPFVLTIAGSYALPALPINKTAAWALKDWQIGALMSYSSGLPIPTPLAANSSTLNNQIFQQTLAVRVPGQPLFSVPGNNLNCHCFDPNATFVLNENAWANPAAGQFGGAEFYSDFRYFRHPNENLNLGRTFRFKESMSLNIRVEFNNVFNRTYLNNPQTTGYTNPQIFRGGVSTPGFGWINPAVASNQFGQPRNGVIVARFQF